MQSSGPPNGPCITSVFGGGLQPTMPRFRHTPAVAARRHMSVGTAFHPRTAPLNRKQQWREWSGYFASSASTPTPTTSSTTRSARRPRSSTSRRSTSTASRGPDALRLVDRVITRDATKLEVGRGLLHALVRRARQGHRRRHDPSARRGRFRWTAADPQLRWLTPERAGLDVDDRGRRPRPIAAARAPGSAVAGPCSRRRPGSRSATCATSGGGASTVGGSRDRRVPDRLHRRPRLRAVDPGRARGRRVGRADGGRAGRTASGRRACSRSTSCGSRRGSSCSRSTTPRRATP